MVGEVSAAESNHIGQKKADLVAKARRRNPASAREGQIQVAVPRWMDGPYIKRCMAEWGCNEERATKRIRLNENCLCGCPMPSNYMECRQGAGCMPMGDYLAIEGEGGKDE